MLDFSCSQNVSDQRGSGKLGLFAGGPPANKSLGFQNSIIEIGNILFVFHPQKSPPHFYVFRGGSLSRSGCVTQSVSQSVTDSRFNKNKKNEH